MTAPRCRLMVLVLCAAAAPAAAHSVVIYTGRIDWQGDQLRLLVDFTAHIREHEARAFANDLTYERLARELAYCLVVYSEAGDRLSAPQVTLRDGNKGADFTFTVPRDASALALLHQPAGPLATLQRQFQLRYSPSAGASERVLRLTSGRNHAVVERNHATLYAGWLDKFAEPVMRLAAGEGDSDVVVTIDIPCPLLATWAEFTFVDVRIPGDWARQRQSTIHAWVNANLSCPSSEDGHQTWRIADAHLISADDTRLDSPSNAWVGMYTTRLRIVVVIAQTPLPADFDLAWRGLNQTVMRIPVIWDGRELPPIGELTLTQNVVRLIREGPLRAAVVSSLAQANGTVPETTGDTDGR